MADDNGGITYDGDVSKDELGTLKDVSKAAQQSKERVAASISAAEHRKIEAQRLERLNGPKDPAKTQAGLRSSDLRSVARSQTPPRDPGGPQTPRNPPTNDPPPKKPPTSQAMASPPQRMANSGRRDVPATISEPKHVSKQELGTLKAPTKAQLQTQPNAASYSPEKQQKVAAQWKQTQTKAMNYVRGQTAERGSNRSPAAQNQPQPAASAKPRADNPAQLAQTQAKQQQKAATQNIFDKYKQQREKSKEQQQQKEKGRGR